MPVSREWHATGYPKGCGGHGPSPAALYPDITAGPLSKLPTDDREEPAQGKFAVPEQRKYPIEDAAHARNSKARAAQQEKAGNLSKVDR